MKPQRFEIGQAVTRKQIPWFTATSSVKPKQGEVYHISEYVHFKQLQKHGNPFPEWYVRFEEHPRTVAHRESDYDPVISDSELTELLKEETVTVTI